MTRLSEQAFDELERVGGVSLNAEHRRRIERALQRYERQRRAQPKTHKLAAALAKSLEQSIGLINRMQDEHPRTWQHITGVTPLPDADLTSLRAFQANCKKYGGAHQGRPPDIFKPWFLTELAKIFVAAGGEPRNLAWDKSKKTWTVFGLSIFCTRTFAERSKTEQRCNWSCVAADLCSA